MKPEIHIYREGTVTMTDQIRSQQYKRSPEDTTRVTSLFTSPLANHQAFPVHQSSRHPETTQLAQS